MNGRTFLLAGLISLASPALSHADWRDGPGNNGHDHSHERHDNGHHDNSDHRDYHGDKARWDRDGRTDFPRRDGQFGNGVGRGKPGINGVGGDRAIGSGVRSGELTGREVQGLEEQKRNIADEERRYRADGQLTSKEREDLAKDTAAYHKDLNHELNDGEHR